MPKVSIIVAIYNAEKTLCRCINSLIGQSLHDIEILLVDDGSTDKSGIICDTYAQSDSRIVVIHKENEGVSPTKQLGLERASGDFIIFLDSDDYVEPDIYEKMYRKAIEENADIVCCDIRRLEKNGTRTEKHRIPSFEHEVFLDGIIDVLFGSICNRMIRRTLLNEYGVRFSPEISFGEDKLVLVELLSKTLADNKILKISYVPEALLNYDITANPSSLMKLDAPEKLSAQLLLWKKMGEHLDLTRFGRTYYLLLLKHGFKNFWNQTVSKKIFQESFSPMISGIRRYAPNSPMKSLVMMAASGKWDLARKMRWIALGRILSDKIKIRLENK